ncbi:hypothetical protein CA13_66950 [Planctomycetes bacterium CA13]|uniref:Uncharacterized protein n=1 Tax=Novipirellula herctigrandis TaxID=2527986 RepID=A0A5C5YMP5_9BACT|nr:hypothetical protein CA13_66950 [Planctomycetes bacterium CA13]
MVQKHHPKSNRFRHATKPPKQPGTLGEQPKYWDTFDKETQDRLKLLKIDDPQSRDADNRPYPKKLTHAILFFLVVEKKRVFKLHELTEHMAKVQGWAIEKTCVAKTIQRLRRQGRIKSRCTGGWYVVSFVEGDK